MLCLNTYYNVFLQILFKIQQAQGQNTYLIFFFMITVMKNMFFTIMTFVTTCMKTWLIGYYPSLLA